MFYLRLYLSHLKSVKTEFYRWCAISKRALLHLDPTAMTSTTVEPFAHPLHPSITSRIDPEYAAYHNDKLLYWMQVHEKPWSPAVRSGPTVPGGSEPLPVGSTKDYSTIATRAPWLRVFTPDGPKPQGGWPAFIYFHGGTSFQYHIVPSAETTTTGG